MQACRKKGRVVLVGDVGLHLQRVGHVREGARLPHLHLVRPRPLRRRLRGRGPGLPDRLRPLDREPQHGGVPPPARRRARLARGPRAGDISGRRGRRRPTRRSKSSESKPLLVLLSYPGARGRARRGRRGCGRSRRSRASSASRSSAPAPSRRRSTCRTWSSCATHYELRAVMSRTGATAKAVAARAEAALRDDRPRRGARRTTRSTSS